MKCEKCNSTWNSDIQVNICPFCGNSLKPSFTSFCDSVKYIVDNYGLDALKNREKTLNILKDVFTEMSIGLERLIIVAYEDGCIDMIIDCKNSNEINSVANKIVDCLLSNFYASEIVNGFVGELVSALNFDNDSSTVVKSNTDVDSTFENDELMNSYSVPESIEVPATSDEVPENDISFDGVEDSGEELKTKVEDFDPFSSLKINQEDSSMVDSDVEIKVDSDSNDFVCKHCGYKSSTKFEMCPNCYELV